MEGVIVLLHLMHRNASPECRKEALEVLDKIFKNILDYPSETKYRRINMTSAMWTHRVTRAFYPLQLIEWLATSGFEQDTEHSVLQLTTRDVNGIAKVRGDTRILLSAYAGSSDDTIKKGTKMKEFLQHLRSVVGLNEKSERNISDSQQDVAYAPETFVSRVSVTNEMWEVIKDDLRAMVLHCMCELPSHGRLRKATFFPPLLPCNSSVAWESLRRIAPMVSFLEMEEIFSLMDAELFDARERDVNTGLADKVSLKEGAQKRIAERHKSDLLRQMDKGTRVHSEMHLVGTRLIADIASCMDQISALEGGGGMIRNDRLEAKRLLKKFKEDGDIVYLHQLKDEWSVRLEMVKQKCGKQFVYL